ncbi:hypothetical protein COCNU_scaffold001319G000020 [Cocos nucifera]|nr:hypothetical protein [Cocos nucifera]
MSQARSQLSQVMMAPKCHLAFIPVPRWVTHSSTSKEQLEHTPSTSTLTAQGHPPLVSTPLMAYTPSMTSTPPAAEPLPSQAFECASSSWIFHGPTHMAHVWNQQHQVMVQYDAEEMLVGETMQEMHSFFEMLVRWSDIIFVEPRD